MDRKQLGRLGLGMAIAYYTQQGYTISLPLNDTQWYDLIIEQDGQFQTVQCKATSTAQNKIDLRSKGGTCGDVYDHIFNHPIDRLFCVSAEGILYDIPTNEMPQCNTFTLRTERTVNNQGFQSYKYIVKLDG